MLSTTRLLLRGGGCLVPSLARFRPPLIGASQSIAVRNHETSATFKLPECKLHALTDAPSSETTLSRDDALKMFSDMYAIRRLETAAGNMYKSKLIRGFLHLYNGQEAISVGIEEALTAKDVIVTGYRCHGFAYCRGIDLIGILAELCGRRSGVVGGKGGSMHMYTPSFLGGNGIVGAQVPIGAGAALALKLRGDENVAVTLYGDGAANQGQCFEAFNMAQLWRLPCVFVIENNGFGMGTTAERSSASTDYYTRGDYMSGLWIDAMDVLAVREAMRFAKERCTGGHGPLLIEMATYRYYGHSMSDPGTSYRTREEVQQVRKTRDPIVLFRERIVEAGLCDDDELKVIEKTLSKEVAEAQKQAESDAFLPLDALYEDVYVDNDSWAFRGTNVLEGQLSSQ